jgi:serine/threonine protein kinase
MLGISQASKTIQQKELLIGQNLQQGVYTIQRLQGRGGMSTVYLALHNSLRIPFALKQCQADAPLPESATLELKTLLHSHTTQNSTPSTPHADLPRSGGIQTDSFLREALLLARLHHPALPTLHDYFFEDGYWYLVMDYLPGPTLSTYLQQHAPLPALEALNYAVQLCDILEYLHQNTPVVIYRDLKPANIILSPNGSLKLIDFGIARYLTPSHTNEQLEFGSPGYTPPEQYHSEGLLDIRSDLFSLGIILYEMIYGKRPEAMQKDPEIFEIPSQTLQSLLTLSMHTLPEKRFQSTHVFSLALARAYDIEERRAYQRYLHAPQIVPTVTLISEQSLQRRSALLENTVKVDRSKIQSISFLPQPQTTPIQYIESLNLFQLLYTQRLLRRSAQSVFLLLLLLILLLTSLLVTVRLAPHAITKSHISRQQP